jgi:hypothetical protein
LSERSQDGRGDAGRRNAGAFLGPSGTFPAAMHTLSDEIPREPDELEAERRGPVRAEGTVREEGRAARVRDRVRSLLRRSGRRA